MKKNVLAVAVVSAFALMGCETEECKGFITRCNGQQVEHCLRGRLSPEELCEAPNSCVNFEDAGFAVCAIPGRNCGDGGIGTCEQNARIVCSTDSRAPGISVIQGNPCGMQTCRKPDAGSPPVCQ
jgi:hypothetical protein